MKKFIYKWFMSSIIGLVAGLIICNFSEIKICGISQFLGAAAGAFIVALVLSVIVLIVNKENTHLPRSFNDFFGELSCLSLVQLLARLLARILLYLREV